MQKCLLVLLVAVLVVVGVEGEARTKGHLHTSFSKLPKRARKGGASK